MSERIVELCIKWINIAGMIFLVKFNQIWLKPETSLCLLQVHSSSGSSEVQQKPV